MLRIFIPCLAAAALTLAAPKGPTTPDARALKIESRLWKEYGKLVRGIEVPVISTLELRKIIDDTGLVLIDVRHPHEQAVSMLPHAITPHEFAERFRRGIPKGKRLVVYCTIGYRSAKYAQELAAQGIGAQNLEGGLMAWTHDLGPLLADSAGVKVPTRKVHVYSEGWNYLHPDFKPVW